MAAAIAFAALCPQGDAAAQTLVADFPKANAFSVGIDSAGARVSYLVGADRLEQIDVSTGRRTILHKFERRGDAFMSSNVVLAPTGRWVAGAANKMLAIVEQPSGRLLRILVSPGHDLMNLAASPTGDRIAGSGQGFKGVAIWDISSGRLLRRLQDKSAEGSIALAWSPRGEFLAEGGRDWPRAQVILWDALAGHIVRRLRGGLAPVHGVAFSPDGRLVVACDRNGQLIAWEVSSGKVLWVSQAADDLRGVGIGFLRHGQCLVVGGGVPGGGMTVLDVLTGRKISSWIAHGPLASVNSMQSCRGRNLVVSSGTDGGVRIWDLDPLLRAHAKHR